MKIKAICGLVSVGLLGFVGCGGDDSDGTPAGTTGGNSSLGGASNMTGGSGGMSTAGMSGAQTGGMNMGTGICPEQQPQGDCDAVGPGTMCTYGDFECRCSNGGNWLCENTLCPMDRPMPGDACTNDGLRCNYRGRNVCDCAVDKWQCYQTQPQNCPMNPPTSGTACPGLGGTFCDYSVMTANDISAAGAAGAAGAMAIAGAAGAEAAGAGGTTSGGSGGGAAGGSPSVAGSAGMPGTLPAIGCGCSPQNQTWFCL